MEPYTVIPPSPGTAIKGAFTIPLVALDGTSAGLSADGTTLALITHRTDFRRFPRKETSFLIVDVEKSGRLRPREPLTLPGDFSFDALVTGWHG
jgi:hypothetical protein